MIIASHLLGDVEATCTHLAVVSEGQVVLAGASGDLLRKARTGRASEVHVESTHTEKLADLGIAFEPSRYPGLIMLATEMNDEELFMALANARIVPRRVEPRVTVLSLYLDAIRDREGSEP